MSDTVNKEEIGHIVTADELVIDEAAIIREQERLANEARKKKAAKTRNIVIVVIIVVLIAIVIALLLLKNKMNKEAESTVKIETSIGQSITFARLDTVKGNEITYTVLKEINESDAQADSTDMGSFEDGERPEVPGGFSGNSNGEMPDFSSFEGGEMPEMPEGFSGNSNGEMPDFSSFEDGERPEMPEGFTGNGNVEMPDMSSFKNGGNTTDRSDRGNRGSKNTSSASVLTYDDKNYELTDETATELIPVGTVVTTKLGTKTTFSRLAAGDYVAIVTDTVNGETTIISMYIVG